MGDKMDELLTGFYNFKKSMEARFDEVDRRFDGLENRMDSLENRMENLENRMGSLEDRMDSQENRMDNLENRIDKLEVKMNEGFREVHTAIKELDKSQEQILNTLDLYKKDMTNIRQHLMALENREKYV